MTTSFDSVIVSLSSPGKFPLLLSMTLLLFLECQDMPYTLHFIFLFLFLRYVTCQAILICIFIFFPNPG